MKNRPLIALALPALLAACGGGGGGGPQFDTIPLSDLGFAGDADIQAAGETTFTLPQVQRIIRTEEGIARLERQDLVVSYDVSEDVYTLDVQGETFDLERDGAIYIFEEGDDVVIFDPFSEDVGTTAFNLFTVLDGELNDAYVVLGFDTSPEDVARQPGTGTYTGTLDVSLRRDEFNDAFGNGDIELIADFEDGTIGGTAIIEDDEASNAEFTFDTVTLDLNDTAIDENGFAGTISVTSGDIDGELVDGGYDGRFFGDDAQAVGGGIYGQIDVDGSDSDTFVNGYFLGGREGD